MNHDIEVKRGIEIISRVVQEHGCTLEAHQIGLRESYYFEIKDKQSSTDFTLSEEFLSDLPNTKDHQTHLKSALSNIFSRLKTGSPNDFYAISGNPFNLHIQWPINRHPSRDVVWIRADVRDLRYPDLVAKTAAVVSGAEHDDFQFKPFSRIRAVVNAVRTSLDDSGLDFFSASAHPAELQEVSVHEATHRPRATDGAVEQFIAAKVYWLGFKVRDVFSVSWIADPWDASYLGVSVRELVQAARVVQARGLIKVSSDNEFATAEDVLILSAKQSADMPKKRRIGFF